MFFFSVVYRRQLDVSVDDVERDGSDNCDATTALRTSLSFR